MYWYYNLMKVHGFLQNRSHVCIFIHLRWGRFYSGKCHWGKVYYSEEDHSPSLGHIKATSPQSHFQSKWCFCAFWIEKNLPISCEKPNINTLINWPYLPLISTGNLPTQTGLGLMQDKGMTIMAENINRMRYMSHFRAIHRGSFFQEMRTTEVRALLPDAWGFICPVHTPGPLTSSSVCFFKKIAVSLNNDQLEDMDTSLNFQTRSLSTWISQRLFELWLKLFIL